MGRASASCAASLRKHAAMTSLTARVRSWLFGSDPEAPAPAQNSVRAAGTAAPAAATPGVRQAERDRMFAQFTNRLQGLLADKRSLPYGQIHVIGLDKLSARLGDRWPKIKDRVYATADRIISGQLTQSDVYVRYSDNEYLLVFANLSAEAARLKCVKLAEEICAFFLGEPDLRDITVKTAVGQVDDRLVFEETKASGVLAGLAESATKIEAPAARVGVPESPPPKPARSVSDCYARKSDGTVTTAPFVVPRARMPESNGIVRRRAPSTLRPPGDNDLWGIVEQLPAFENDGGRAAAMFSYAYRPIWDIKNKLLSTYRCVPVRLFPGFGRRYGYAALDNAKDSFAVARLDLETFKEALCMLDELQRNRFQIFMAVPVQFETLANHRYREVYIEIAHRIPDRMRKFLVMDMVEVPDGVPHTRLTEIVMTIKPFCSAVLLRTTLREKALSHFLDLGLHSVGVQVRREQLPEAEFIARLGQFVAEAERLRLWTYVYGVKTTTLAKAACAAGVRYLAGDRIGEPIEVPMHVHRFKWEDLLSAGTA